MVDGSGRLSSRWAREAPTKPDTKATPAAMMSEMAKAMVGGRDSPPPALRAAAAPSSEAGTPLDSTVCSRTSTSSARRMPPP